MFGNGKNHHSPKKPDTPEGQLSVLWDVVCNHVLTWMAWQDVKMGFIIALLAINVALLAVLCALKIAS